MDNFEMQQLEQHIQFGVASGIQNGFEAVKETDTRIAELVAKISVIDDENDRLAVEFDKINALLCRLKAAWYFVSDYREVPADVAVVMDDIDSLVSAVPDALVIADGYAAADIGGHSGDLGKAKMRIFPDKELIGGPLADIPITIAVWARKENP